MPDITSLPVPATGPVLSTPDTNIFEQPVAVEAQTSHSRSRSQEELYLTYEIERTVQEIRVGGWHRVALQFPDHMLQDAPWVSRTLSRELRQARRRQNPDLKPTEDSSQAQKEGVESTQNHLEKSVKDLDLSRHVAESAEKLAILADTSYGACCVDEIAAEHADAEVVIHYGRSCLSPTARLPVIYCFTKPPLALEPVVAAFQDIYSDLHQRIILMSDLPYSHALPQVAAMLQELGYTDVHLTKVIHNTSSALPNRTVPDKVQENVSALQEWALFHLSEPSPSLLLNLTSKVGSIHILPVDANGQIKTSGAVESSTKMILRRRYALLTSLTTVPIFGILVNTLSVRDYMTILRHVTDAIAAAGKKSYTFVVGKVNAAKVANFSEVGGWVVIGCWESSLFDSSDFWKPMITPFELDLALETDASRVWTSAWSSDFQTVLGRASGESNDPLHNMSSTTPRTSTPRSSPKPRSTSTSTPRMRSRSRLTSSAVDTESEEESEPPEFDLRTGRYVTHSRPTGGARVTTDTDLGIGNTASDTMPTSQSLTRRATGSLIRTRDATFPAAAFFRDKRTWQGLGSDYEVAYDESGGVVPDKGTHVEQGRHGIARGYTLGEDDAET